MCGQLSLICSAYAKKPTKLTSAFLMNRPISSPPMLLPSFSQCDLRPCFLILWGLDSLQSNKVSSGWLVDIRCNLLCNKPWDPGCPWLWKAINLESLFAIIMHVVSFISSGVVSSILGAMICFHTWIRSYILKEVYRRISLGNKYGPWLRLRNQYAFSQLFLLLVHIIFLIFRSPKPPSLPKEMDNDKWPADEIPTELVPPYQRSRLQG